MKKMFLVCVILYCSFLVTICWSKNLFCIKQKCYTEEDIKNISQLFSPYFKTSKNEFCKALLRMS